MQVYQRMVVENHFQGASSREMLAVMRIAAIKDGMGVPDCGTLITINPAARLTIAASECWPLRSGSQSQIAVVSCLLWYSLFRRKRPSQRLKTGASTPRRPRSIGGWFDLRHTTHDTASMLDYAG